MQSVVPKQLDKVDKHIRSSQTQGSKRQDAPARVEAEDSKLPLRGIGVPKASSNEVGGINVETSLKRASLSVSKRVLLSSASHSRSLVSLSDLHQISTVTQLSPSTNTSDSAEIHHLSAESTEMGAEMNEVVQTEGEIIKVSEQPVARNRSSLGLINEAKPKRSAMKDCRTALDQVVFASPKPEGIMDLEERKHSVPQGALHSSFRASNRHPRSDSDTEPNTNGDEDLQWEILEEMHRQLKAATKVVATLKLKVQDLSEANLRLQDSETSLQSKLLTMQQSELALLSKLANNEQLGILRGSEDPDTGLEAKKMVKLCQEQMAKNMAKHRKELEEWATRCRTLEGTIQEQLSSMSSLNEKIKADEQTITTLKEEIAKVLFPLKRIRVDAEAQTKSRPAWRWITILRMIADIHEPSVMVAQKISVAGKSISTQTAVDFRDSSTITDVELPAFGPLPAFDGWWAKVMQGASEEVSSLALKGKMMSSQQLLSHISDIYVQKIVLNEIDSREGNSIQSLAACMHNSYLRIEGNPKAAQAACVSLVANVLAYIKSTAPSSVTEITDFARTRGQGEKEFAPSGIETKLICQDCTRRRVALFGRFLGIQVDDMPPLSEFVCNIFLAVLMKAQPSVLPLFSLSGERIVIALARVIKILDHVFDIMKARSVDKERIKVELANDIAELDVVDLDRAIEFIIIHLVDLHQKREIRLHALFAASCRAGKMDSHHFHNMLLKVSIDCALMPTHHQRLRIYQLLCIFDRIDSDAFVRVAREYLFRSSIFPRELCMPGVNSPTEHESLFDKLEPLYTVIYHTYEPLGSGHNSVLFDLDNQGVGNGLAVKWEALKKLFEERQNPELAWILYDAVVKQYRRANRGNKKMDSSDVSAHSISPDLTAEPRARTRRSSLSNLGERGLMNEAAKRGRSSSPEAQTKDENAGESGIKQDRGTSVKVNTPQRRGRSLSQQWQSSDEMLRDKRDIPKGEKLQKPELAAMVI